MSNFFFTKKGGGGRKEFEEKKSDMNEEAINRNSYLFRGDFKQGWGAGKFFFGSGSGS